MFRSALGDFEDDPFFRDHHQRMSSMMRGFHDPFSHFGFPSALPGIENGGQAGRSSRGGQQLARPPDMFGSMFGDMFTNMNSMMANMHRNFEQMANDPNTFSYSSSSVMSYSNDGRGEPKYFQASRSTKKAPGGIKETQHSVRDSESGLHRMAIGHHLDDRSHIIERSMNRRSGEEERKQDFINLEESDAAAFDQEWKERTRQSTHILRDRQRATLRGLEAYPYAPLVTSSIKVSPDSLEPRERTTHLSRHAGIAAPSRKDKGTIRDKDRLKVNDEGPGTYREFDNGHHDYGAARDKDWGSGDFERAGRSPKSRHDREKHVRINSRPVNRHEPRGGL